MALATTIAQDGERKHETLGEEQEQVGIKFNTLTVMQAAEALDCCPSPSWVVERTQNVQGEGGVNRLLVTVPPSVGLKVRVHG